MAHKAKARIGRQPPPVIAVKRKMGTDEKVMLGGVAVEAYEVGEDTDLSPGTRRDGHGR